MGEPRDKYWVSKVPESTDKVDIRILHHLVGEKGEAVRRGQACHLDQRASDNIHPVMMTDAIDQTSRCFIIMIMSRLALGEDSATRVHHSIRVSINSGVGSNSHKLMEETVRGEVWGRSQECEVSGACRPHGSSANRTMDDF